MGYSFVADYAAGTPNPSEETPEVTWFSEAQAFSRIEHPVNRIEHPVNRDRLKDLLECGETLRFYRYTTELETGTLIFETGTLIFKCPF